MNNRELYGNIRDVYHQLQKNLDKAIEQYDISYVQFGVIQVLAKSGKVSMSKLIENMGCVPSNMTTMIQRMKRDGYVMTEKNPNDQRETLVYLTEKGEETKKQVDVQYGDFLKENCGCFTKEEEEHLETLLIKWKKHLD
ncbi:MarR family winged helix-turn-helix transcriptional regulator [Bacillus paramycoides]|uniref:MarR family transcriptional regulator n=1 Tax=Bacillus paramycoides TaxID=2026194 RepID=A0ABU6MXC6_9BACI|nr:MarR family transcriptional regulator [Bacillus paramycoides]MED1557488.1 MarR family transcriptional regulator [Bacillus paramycoides]MED1567519.1 MarR family transcriptional regulator [Bacillus paramycoides]PFD28278.1 MarR family transcriptional regulator [Bacillus cereus]PGM62369.1 MarR family transcriptional regulator [Bacillus cereus]